MALLKSKGAVKLVEEDGHFKAQVDTDMGPMPLGSYVKDWSGSEEGKIYIKKATGGDAQGGTGARFAEQWTDATRGRLINIVFGLIKMASFFCALKCRQLLIPEDERHHWPLWRAWLHPAKIRLLPWR